MQRFLNFKIEKSVIFLNFLLGDSGGGFISKDTRTLQWTIFGIVSVGVSTESGCNPANYVVFVSVHKFLPWILKIAENGDKNGIF